MDIRIIGGGAAAVVFAATGFNYVAMEDVLSHELRDINTVQPSELQSYMDSVVEEFEAAYGYYAYETETYAFVGDLEFSANASTATFYEVVRSEDALNEADRKQIGDDIRAAQYCNSDDALMFTNKGYNYSVSISDGEGRNIMSEVCWTSRSSASPVS